MTHFAVLAIHHPDDSLDDLMEPYSESVEVPERWESEGTDAHDFFATEGWVEEGKLTADATMTDLLAVIGQEWPDEADFYRVRGDSLERRTTYNPLSKWDYWGPGYKWLQLRSDHNEFPEFVGGSWRGFDEGPPGMVTRARKRDLDIAGMRSIAEITASGQYELYSDLQRVHGLPDDTWLLKFDSDRAAGLAGREAYWEHPMIKAMLAADLGSGMFSLPTEEFINVGRDVYVQRARLRALPGYATLDGLHEDENEGTPGTWLDPGRVGRFGSSDSTPDRKWSYLRAANEAIDDAPDETIFSVLDCHI